jgi:hypothetical protein
MRMNSKAIGFLALGAAILGCLFIVASARRGPPDATRASAATTSPPAFAPPSGDLAKGPTSDALDEKLRRLEERAKQLQSERDERALEEKEKRLKLVVAEAKVLAKSCAAQWISGYNLTDAQRGPLLSLFERWLAQDAAREQYRSLDRATFEAREADVRSLLTPEQQLARHAAVKEQIQDVWKSLSNSVSCIQQDQDPGFLMMGPPWTPASRAASAHLLKQFEELQSRSIPQSGSAPPAFRPDFLGECPPIPDTVLLADAHDLGILGLWRQAESRARSLLTPAQQENYDKLLPKAENPVYHHGY